MLRWHLVTIEQAIEYYYDDLVLEASVPDSGTQFFVKDIKEDDEGIGVYINGTWFPWGQKIHIKILPVCRYL
jgi:hypothetical protein